MLNPDFRDMLSALSAEGAEFLLVGAFAMAVHGYPRATGDMDIWIRPSDENAGRVWRALRQFKAPMRNLSVEDLKSPDTVFQIGVAPRRIDLLTSIDGVEFDDAWAAPEDHRPGRTTGRSSRARRPAAQQEGLHSAQGSSRRPLAGERRTVSRL